MPLRKNGSGKRKEVLAYLPKFINICWNDWNPALIVLQMRKYHKYGMFFSVLSFKAFRRCCLFLLGYGTNRKPSALRKFIISKVCFNYGKQSYIVLKSQLHEKVFCSADNITLTFMLLHRSAKTIKLKHG